MSMARITRKPLQFIGHLERYVWACLHCHQKEVVDLGCKDGYGSNILSSFAGKITLLDNDQWRLDKAKALYKFQCPVEFKNVDLEQKTIGGPYDVIVAFEIIEHVANRDFLLTNIVQSLRPGGILLFSVPHMIENECHTHLYDEGGIKDFIGKYLTITEFYVQDKVGISGKPSLFPPKGYVGVAQL